MMNKMVRILIALILVIGLSAGGFLAGYHIKAEVKLDAPIQENQIYLTVEGISPSKCVAFVQGDLAANRLVENLMLRCTPDDLRESIRSEVTGKDAFVVKIPMDAEGQMVYFADELAYILNEEMGKEVENARITVTEQKLLTTDTESRNSITNGCIGAGIGGVLGLLSGAVILLTGKKKPEGKFSKS